jgi:metal-responsive CopG/Arc/MetJ family transcriptional regulator
MTARTAKIACSIDSALLASAERLRARTGESRSALIARALSGLLAEQAHRARVQAYVEGYRARPESAAEVARARKTSRAALARVEWDDE